MAMNAAKSQATFMLSKTLVVWWKYESVPMVGAWEWTQTIRSLKRFIQNTDSFTNETTQLQRMRTSIAVTTLTLVKCHVAFK